MHAVKDSKLDMQKEFFENRVIDPEVDQRIYPPYPAGLPVQAGLLIYPMLYACR